MLKRSGSAGDDANHPRLVFLALVIALLAAACLLPAADASGREPSAGKSAGGSTSLAVRVSGLPPRVAARIIVRGPRLSKALKRSQTLSRLRPGRYTFTIQQVKIAGRRSGVQAGSLALPSKPRVRVRVKAGQTGSVTLKYGTIVNANVLRLDLRPLSVQGDPNNPSAVVLPASFRARAGTILTAKPSSRLPAGLFHRVTAARRSGRRVALKLKPAGLAEAFPQLDIDTRLDLAPGKVAVGQPTTAAFNPLVASLGIGKFRCSLPLADSRLSAQHRFDVDAEVQIQIPKRFGIPVGRPNGRLALTLRGSASIEAFIRKNTGCSASVNLPPLPGAIPVGPVVVPVYAQVGLGGSASIGADLRETASVGFTLRAGMAFRGTSVENISTASANASASASGAGKLSVGPTIRFAVGVARVADVHLDAKPSLAFTAALDRSCSLDLVGGSQAGVSVGPFQLNQNLPAPKKNLYRCPAQRGPGPAQGPGPAPQSGPAPGLTAPRLTIAQTGPLGAFLNQAFDYSIRVTNTGSGTARDVEVVDTLPAAGSFISSSPGGSPTSPAARGTYTIPLGDVPAGEARTVTVRWRAPAVETTLTNSAVVRASNAPQDGPATAAVPVGTTANCNPCGAESRGTGLRNRDHGAITIAGIPAGATVGRAVLVWGILYNGGLPPNTITFDGHPVSADVTSSVSGTLCWGDSATVGYAADVTPYVTGNGTFNITDPPRGITRADGDPVGTLPYTDGATLVVFYTGGGAQNQVLSDFSYDTNTDGDGAIARSFSAINSVGGPSSLTLAGPDGQSNFGETFSFTGAGGQMLEDTWNGSDPQDGPSFSIGNLWDTDRYDVTSILPAGQQTLSFGHRLASDCIGVGAAVLQVSQRTG